MGSVEKNLSSNRTCLLGKSSWEWNNDDEERKEYSDFNNRVSE